MKRLWKMLESYIYPLLILLIAAFLSYANYTPGTFLSGWDTLHPEFNFPLAFERMLNGVWRADQGLGAVAIQSHMADLPRVLFLWLESFVLPLNTLRYSYFFLMLATGPLGMYALVSSLTKRRLAGFAAGLTYLANLGTVQHFVMPLEMFATQYGLLPWVLLLSFKLLNGFTRTRLLVFSAVTVIASSQAHTATLFYGFLATYVLFLLFYVGLHGMTVLKRAVVLILITITLNAYWMLPNIYAAKNHGLEVKNSKVNRLFSQKAFAKGKNYGTVENAMILKNFLFDWELYRFDRRPQQMEQIMKPWEEHLKNPLVAGIGYGVFVLSLIGIAGAVYFREKRALALLPMYVVSFLMLMGGTYPVTTLFERLAMVSPVLAEALRFPFTKFSIVFMATMSVYAGFGLHFLFGFMKRLYTLQHTIAISYAALLLVYFLPAFGGNLIHPSMRIGYPKEYREMFDWFSKQDKNARVAILPIQTFWNWVYYDWGYQGAGFLQFGIPQPILDRDYDRWSRYNEQYQREMTYAVYSMRPALLRQVLEKYNIRYLLFDDSVVNLGGRHEAKFGWAIPGLLARTGIAREVAKFGEKITVYEIATSTKPVALYDELPSVGPAMNGGQEDTAYAALRTYITKESGNHLTDPYRSTFTSDERFVADVADKTLVASFTPAINALEPLRPCGVEKLNGTRETVDGAWQYTSVNGPVCDHFAFPVLKHEKGYIFEITHRNIEGFPLQVCVSDTFNRRCDLITHLRKSDTLTIERFLLPPLFDWSTSYTVDINNFAINGRKTVNDLAQIRVYEINYWQFTGQPEQTLEQVTTEMPSASELKVYPSKQIRLVSDALWYYVVEIPAQQKDGVLVLDQAYENGWIAFVRTNTFPFITSAGNHVLVNNWANGWILDPEPNTINYEPSTIYLFFVPQLLEFLGFVLLPLPFILALSERQRVEGLTLGKQSWLY